MVLFFGAAAGAMNGLRSKEELLLFARFGLHLGVSLFAHNPAFSPPMHLFKRALAQLEKFIGGVKRWTQLLKC